MKRFSAWSVCVVSIALSMVLSAVSLAAQAPAQDQFVPIENLPKQELSPAPLLYGAYAFVWGVLVIYVFLLWRRIARVERELQDVARRLKAK